MPLISVAKSLYPTYITNVVFNVFLSYTAITLNIATIHAVKKTPSLFKPLKSLLLSLAVSDLGVGLLVQPFYVASLVQWFKQSKSAVCEIYKVFITTSTLFTLTSYFSVVLISVDRFLAIHLHLRYQELVTYKRVVTSVVSIWIFSAILTVNDLWIPGIISRAVATILLFCFIITTVVYCKIYFVVRRHLRAIQASGEVMANSARLVKSALGTFYVYLVFVICYLPFYCILVLMISGSRVTEEGSVLYSWTLMFLNSSLNPVIYCWKMRQIRHAIMDTLRNILPSTTEQ